MVVEGAEIDGARDHSGRGGYIAAGLVAPEQLTADGIEGVEMVVEGAGVDHACGDGRRRGDRPVRRVAPELVFGRRMGRRTPGFAFGRRVERVEVAVVGAYVDDVFHNQRRGQDAAGGPVTPEHLAAGGIEGVEMFIG